MEKTGAGATIKKRGKKKEWIICKIFSIRACVCSWLETFSCKNIWAGCLLAEECSRREADRYIILSRGFSCFIFMQSNHQLESCFYIALTLTKWPPKFVPWSKICSKIVLKREQHTVAQSGWVEEVTGMLNGGTVKMAEKRESLVPLGPGRLRAD